jgi:hypothetical protein
LDGAGRGDFQAVENLDLEVTERKTKPNITEKTII